MDTPDINESALQSSIRENGPHAVETQELWRVYRVGPKEVTALQAVNLEVPESQFIALKGRSGSGKTTLLNCIGGLDQPTSGSVHVFGQDIGKLREKQLTLWRREKVGFVFQSFGLLPTLSAYENVELMLRLGSKPGKERRQRTLECLELVGLGKWIRHRPYEMSGGQQQRVAIARALANRPRLILADEPTGELDSTTAREILKLFRKIVVDEQITLLIATHDPLVDPFVDQIIQLKDGQIVNLS